MRVSRFASGTRELKKESPFSGRFLVFFWVGMCVGDKNEGIGFSLLPVGDN